MPRTRRPHDRRHRRGDAGFATVWTACTALALCTVLAAVLAMAQVVVARHRAGAAADLAALAAADTALLGPDQACRRAKAVSLAQGARVVRCGLDGEVADVEAESSTGRFTVRVRSRAGPPQEKSTPGGPRASPSPHGG
ncbi:Rv3654c family TadE-like protein [Streptomyces sp. NPDC059740]|uniref:Rv3654c family TadE-like protein n=1 Tax=Streptomyces sp. NPDC059740 TaxID=3346926 RepID=UPI0036531995